MAPFFLHPRFVLMAAALTIPVVASGACGSRTACLAYTQAEYDANHGACLSPTDALTAFTSPQCPGSIVSVDGPGSFDGEICCYPVTYDNLDQSCNGNGNGNGGSTTFPGTTTVITTQTTSMCVGLCSQVLTFGAQPCGGPPLAAFETLESCAGCFGGTSSCTSQCATTLCSNGAIDPGCASCLQTSCPDAWNTCQQN